eukprot:TRINITY_DN1386_c2_g3_i1.p1 TRINITY_DN1386_c2_g3~~TRINITY_DN1386_c2_g3_i1.p1  ORF type:complete len:315 (-),score=113.73 TRINITY_DN1386_c2_g3_i1:21-917(-)
MLSLQNFKNKTLFNFTSKILKTNFLQNFNQLRTFTTTFTTQKNRGTRRIAPEASKKLIVGSAKTSSSKAWLKRQSKDPYVIKAHSEGFHSRAAFKLHQIIQKYSIIKKNSVVIDLGAAPGGWSQVISQIVDKTGFIIAVDKLEMDPIENVNFIQGDFTTPEIQEQISKLLPKNPSLILSDMAPNYSGIKGTDHDRLMELAQIAHEFTKNYLKKGGAFVVKISRGGTDKVFKTELEKTFNQVNFVKPDASRTESSEIYIVCCNKISNPKLKKIEEKLKNQVKKIEQTKSNDQDLPIENK